MKYIQKWLTLIEAIEDAVEILTCVERLSADSEWLFVEGSDWEIRASNLDPAFFKGSCTIFASMLGFETTLDLFDNFRSFSSRLFFRTSCWGVSGISGVDSFSSAEGISSTTDTFFFKTVEGFAVGVLPSNLSVDVFDLTSTDDCRGFTIVSVEDFDGTRLSVSDFSVVVFKTRSERGVDKEARLSLFVELSTVLTDTFLSLAARGLMGVDFACCSCSCFFLAAIKLFEVATWVVDLTPEGVARFALQKKNAFLFDFYNLLMNSSLKITTRNTYWVKLKEKERYIGK